MKTIIIIIIIITVLIRTTSRNDYHFSEIFLNFLTTCGFVLVGLKNNNNQMIIMVLPSWQAIAIVEPVHLFTWVTRVAANHRPSQPTWSVRPPHPPSPFIITQPKSWYSFYRPTEGGKPSRTIGTAVRGAAMAQGCTSKDIKTPQRKSNSQKKKQTGMPSCILPARRCPRAVLAMAMCLSVCLSVRHKPVLYPNGLTDRARFWHSCLLLARLHIV